MAALVPSTAIKDPDSTIGWVVKWTDWLSGDTISTSTWTVDGGESPLTLSVSSSSIASDTDSSPEVANQWANVVVAGGTAGVSYILTNEVQTAAGYTDQVSIEVKVWDQ